MRDNAAPMKLRRIAELTATLDLRQRGAVLLKDKEKLEREGQSGLVCFPFQKIKDGLQFATKSDHVHYKWQTFALGD